VISHLYIVYQRRAAVAEEIEKFPPRQKPAAFNLDAVLRHLQDASGDGNH